MTINESDVVFNSRKGHTHDGEDSSLVVIGTGVIDLPNLSSDLVDWILDSSGGASAQTFSDESSDFSSLPDLEFTTGSLVAGASETGVLSWASAALVCSTAIEQENSTLCELTFYHTPAFTNDVKEFKAVEATDGFLWEGVWAHTDDAGTGNVYYRVKNSGSTTSSFTVRIKSATMVSNQDTQMTKLQTIREESTNTSLEIGDVGNIIKMTAASTVFIPTNEDTPIPVGAKVDILRYGSGAVDISSAVDLRAPNGTDLASQYSMASLVKIDTNEWVLTGDVT